VTAAGAVKREHDSGIVRDGRNQGPSAEEIDENRAEMFASFGREDIL
jgi:hypothetical protein